MKAVHFKKSILLQNNIIFEDYKLFWSKWDVTRNISEYFKTLWYSQFTSIFSGIQKNSDEEWYKLFDETWAFESMFVDSTSLIVGRRILNESYIIAIISPIYNKHSYINSHYRFLSIIYESIYIIIMRCKSQQISK